MKTVSCVLRVLAASAVLLLATRVTAQEQVASMAGVVAADGGGPLSGASVEARHVLLGSVLRTHADAAGAYRFPALPPGRYAVTASAPGFTPSRVENVELTLGRIVDLDFTLVVTRSAELVVSSEAPIVDVRQSAGFTTLRGERLTLLPRGIDYLTLAAQAPSGFDESKLHGLSIDGAGANENRYVIDAIDTGNLENGLPAKLLPADFVEEIQVKTTGYAAEYGGATGGVVNVLTRSGSNELHGEAGTYFRSSRLDGTPRPGVRFSPTDLSKAEYYTQPQDPVSTWNPLLSVGGALLRDRAWFYVGWMPETTITDRDVTFQTTHTGGTFTQKEVTQFLSANVSLKPADSVFARVALNLSPYQRSGALPSPDGNGNPAVAYEDLGIRQPNTSVSGNVDVVASSTLALSLRGGFFRADTHDLGIPNGVYYGFDGGNTQFPDIPANLKHPGGYANLLSNKATEKDTRTNTSVQLDGTRFFSWLGDHALKAGVQYNRIENDLLSGEQSPNVTLFWDQSLTTLDGRIVRGKYGYYRVQQRQFRGDVVSKSWGLFLQDAVTLGRVSLNLGLRTENERIPSYSDNPAIPQNAIEFDFSEKLAPRVGIAWDVKGDGRWKAYGSWGVFYDIMKLQLARSSFGGEKWLDYRYSLDTSDWPNLVTSGCPPACPGTFYEVVDYRHPSNDPNDHLIDPNIKPMKTEELTVGVEHALSSTTALGLRYIHKQLDRTIEDVGTIVPGVGEVYQIANPGEGTAEYVLGPDFPATPKPKRDYDALQLELTKRMSDRWMLHASYVLSRLYGNYSGLTNSDQYGRAQPNVLRFFDSLPQSFNQTGQPEYGPLASDRPHEFKLQGAYVMPFGTTVGANFTLASGTPISRYVEMQSNIQVYYAGRGSDGRTPTFSQIDLALRHDVKLGRGLTAQLSLDVLNLLDRATTLTAYQGETKQVIPITNEDFFKGFDVQQLIARYNIQRDPRFLMPDTFQAARTVRVGVRVGW